MSHQTVHEDLGGGGFDSRPIHQILKSKIMYENEESRFSKAMRTAAQCAKLAAGLAFAGLVGVIMIVMLMHVSETHPRVFAALSGVALLIVFIGLTTCLAKQGGDNGMEGMA